MFDDPRRQAYYDDLVAKGTEPAFANSLASWRRFPGSPPTASLGAAGTEQSFFSATEDPLAGVHPFHRNYMLAKLKENGVADLSGKRYMSQLANFAGDPEAAVGSRSDMKRVLESRGWGCDGLVKTKATDRDKPLTHESGPYRVAPDLVEERLLDMERKNPELAAAHKADPKLRADRTESLSAEMSGQTGSKKRRPEAFEHIDGGTQHAEKAFVAD